MPNDRFCCMEGTSRSHPKNLTNNPVPWRNSALAAATPFSVGDNVLATQSDFRGSGKPEFPHLQSIHQVCIAALCTQFSGKFL
jgi:hypothetical protein